MLGANLFLELGFDYADTMMDERKVDGKLLIDEQRLTGFGKFMRSSCLDELPELWNVLR